MVKSSKDSYTMQEIADLMGVNKSSVYRFLRKENIKPATIRNNTQYYSAIAMKNVRRHFQATRNSERKDAHDLLLESLQQQVIDLKKELAEEKVRADTQLAEKDKQIRGYQKLVDQSQQLLLNEQNKELSITTNNVKEGNYSETTYPDEGKKDKSNMKITILKDQIDPKVMQKSKTRSSKKHWWNRLFSNT